MQNIVGAGLGALLAAQFAILPAASRPWIPLSETIASSANASFILYAYLNPFLSAFSATLGKRLLLHF